MLNFHNPNCIKWDNVAGRCVMAAHRSVKRQIRLDSEENVSYIYGSKQLTCGLRLRQGRITYKL